MTFPLKTGSAIHQQLKANTASASKSLMPGWLQNW
jgi:hypothetical protein